MPIRPLALSLLLAAGHVPGHAQQACVPPATELEAISSSEPCNHCRGFLLPGAPEPSPHSVYSIHSDLPEILLTEGVLYGTVPVLPPFALKDGSPLSEDRRTQHNRGFTTIDDDFEVFLFHVSQPGDGTRPRRLVVYTENAGSDTVTIDPRQVIITDGIIGTVHEMESNMGRRVMQEEWDTPIPAMEVAPGGGAIVAYSKQFSAPRNLPDSSANVNCFGLVRARVSSAGKADLRVWVVAVPASVPIDGLGESAKGLLGQGAQSGEGYLDFNKDPEGCQLRRTCGVFRSFVWRSEVVTIDAASLPADGIRFPMALPASQTNGCPAARQTVDLLLHQKYNRPDTVGNYVIDYRVHFRLVNSDTATSRTVDLRFGKDDADIGLGWQVATGAALPSDAEVDGLPVRTAWAGPKQTGDLPDNTRSLFEFDGGAPALAPCSEQWVSARLQVLGNSSLPFQLSVLPMPPSAP